MQHDCTGHVFAPVARGDAPSLLPAYWHGHRLQGVAVCDAATLARCADRAGLRAVALPADGPARLAALSALGRRAAPGLAAGAMAVALVLPMAALGQDASLVPVREIAGLDRVTLRRDGSVLLEFADGRALVLPADAVQVTASGEILVALDALDAATALVPVAVPPALVAAAGTLGAVAADAGDEPGTLPPDPGIGYVVDDYLAFATVFRDADGDGERDPGEIWTTTDATGAFALGALTGGEGRIVASGGHDIATGLPFIGIMTAPEGATVVTPLTTLVQALIEARATGPAPVNATVAEAQLRTQLGLDGPLLSTDPVALATGEAADPGALLIATQVQAVLTLAAAMGADPDAVARTLAEALAQAGTAPLTDAAALAAVIEAGLPAGADAAGAGALAAAVNARAGGLADAGAEEVLLGLAPILTAVAGPLQTVLAEGLDPSGAEAALDAALATARPLRPAFTHDGTIGGAEAAPDGPGAVLGGTGQAGSVVTVLLNGAERSATVAADGTWSVTFAPGDLPTDGPAEATASASLTVASGTLASQTVRLPLVIDRVAPPAPEVDAVGGDDVVTPGELAAGLRFTGTAEAGSRVTIRFDGAEETVTAGATGRWEATFAPGLGPAMGAAVFVTATDAAGNESAATIHPLTVQRMVVATVAGAADPVPLIDATLLAAEADARVEDGAAIFTAGDVVLTLTGPDLTFGADALPLSGIVTGLAVTVAGAPVLALTGLRLEAATLSEAVAAARAGDDTAFDDLLGLHAFDAGVAAGAGATTFTGGPLGDRLSGGAAADRLDGGAGDDRIDGAAGNDTLTGGTGADTLRGGSGNDQIEGGPDADRIEGGEGSDWALYTGDASGVAVNLADGTGMGGEAEGDSLAEIENIRGGSGADLLIGDSGRNVLQGRGGDDTILGGDGDDQLHGGAGSDLLDGGSGTDWLRYDDTADGVAVSLATQSAALGAAAGDTIRGFENLYGSAGDDTLTGDAGNNSLAGHLGNDILDGGEGLDLVLYEDRHGHIHVDLGAGSAVAYDGQGSVLFVDTLSGFEQARTGGGDDTLVAGDGDAFLDGAGGANLILGGAGRDTLRGGAGADTIRGGDGMDQITGGAGADLIDGGGGFNWAQYAGDTAGVRIDLGLGTASGGEAEGDTLAGIQRLRGGSGADRLVGDHGGNVLQGQAGDDTILGGAGDDQIHGGEGADLLDGGVGIDWVRYDDTAAGIEVSLASATAAFGAAAGDSLTGFENVFGSAGDDTLTGDDGSNAIAGHFGNDRLDGRGGIDLLLYEDRHGQVRVDLVEGRATAQDPDGTILFVDTVAGFEHVSTGDGDDTVIGDDNPNRIATSEGDDLVRAGAGDDTLGGSPGADTLFGEAGNDLFATGAGDGAAMPDGSAADVIDGGAGHDTLVAEGTGAAVTVVLSGDRAGHLASGDMAAYADPGYDGTLAPGQRLPDGGTTLDFTAIETFVLGRWNDRFDASADGLGVTVAGGGGDDTLLGGAGDDVLAGDAGTWDYRLYDLGEQPVRSFAEAGFRLDQDGFDPWDNAHSVAETGVTSDLSPGTIDQGHFHAIAYSTVLTVGTAGEYVFDLRYTDGALLFVDGVAVVGDDLGDTGYAARSSDPVILAAGVHRLDVIFIQNEGGQVLDLGMSGPDTGFATVRLSGYAGIAAAGAAGHDHLEGGAGDDRLTGGDGDTIDGGAGDDVVDLNLTGSGAVATASGGAGADRLRITIDSDAAVTVDQAAGEVRAGGTLLARIDGFETIETLTTGGVLLLGGPGAERMTGGQGDDTFTGSAGADTLAGGAGEDTADYSRSADRVIVNLQAGTGTGGEAEGDRYNSIEHLVGTDGNDQLRGSGAANRIDGGAGDDVIWSLGGADTLRGGAGNDTLRYEIGSTAGVHIDLASRHASGGAAEGDDFDGFEHVWGTLFDDTMLGDDGTNILRTDFGSASDSGDDLMDGRGGNDTIYSGAGADTLIGGTGTDWLQYSVGDGQTVGVRVNLGTGEAAGGWAEGDRIEGFEHLRGSRFGDTLTGSEEDNVLLGIEGDDVIDGAGGNDQVYGGPGADHLSGGAGIDWLRYNDTGATEGIAVDLLTGLGSAGWAAGDTVTGFENVYGTAFADVIAGSDEANTLNATEGDDTVLGRGGEDVIHGGAGADWLDGGEGLDLLSYADPDATAGVIVDLGTGEASGGFATGDTIRGFEKLRGTDFADSLRGGAGDEDFFGGDGDDTILGGGGEDRIWSGAGADWLDGGDGENSLIYNNSDAAVIVNLIDMTVAGGEAEGDIIANFQHVNGGAFDDTLIGDGRNSLLQGLDGDDVILAGAGNDTAHGGAGADWMEGGDGYDFLAFGSSAEAVHADLQGGIATGGDATGDTIGGFEALSGSDADDTLLGDGGANVLSGREGADGLTGRGGDDVLRGDGGDDTLDGGDGHDWLFGGYGRDSLLGGAGNDIALLTAGSGQETADLGAGADRLILEGTGAAVQVTLTGSGTGTGRSGDLSVYGSEDGISVADGALQAEGGAEVVFAAVEEFALGSRDDVFDGSAADDAVTVVGGAGDDSLLGGAGGDVLSGDGGTWAYSLWLTDPAIDLAGAGFTGDGGRSNPATPDATGFVTALHPAAIAQIDQFALKFETVLTVTAGGAYRFAMVGDDGARLFVGGQEVLAADGRQGGTPVASQGVTLAAGSHLIEVVYFERTIDQFLDVAFSGPDTGDVFTSLSGHPAIAAPGAAGDDTLVGGAGADVLTGGAGDDTLIGGDGNDTLLGGDGDDVIHAGAGDSVDGGAGDDVVEVVLSGTDTVVTLSGGAGRDTLRLSIHTDAEVVVDHAAQEIRAGAQVIARYDGFEAVEPAVTGGGTVVIVGGGGNDQVTGGPGDDSLNGGAGDDTLYGSPGADRMDGGSGSDTADYSGSLAGVTVSLLNATASGGDAAGDVLAGIENLTGSALADHLSGDGGANRIAGGDGGDTVNGHDGNDTILGEGGNDALRGNGGHDLIDGGAGNDGLIGHDGDDTLLGGDGSDQLYPGYGRDHADGGPGTDWIRYDDTGLGVVLNLGQGIVWGNGVDGTTIANFENVVGSAGNDTIVGDGGNNNLNGIAGDDSIQGGGGNDTIEGHAGADTLDGGAGDDVLNYISSDAAVIVNLRAETVAGGHAEGDVIGSFERVGGSAHADTILGDGDDEDLRGNGGDDLIEGGGGNEWIFGGAGHDLLRGEAGNDSLWGEADDDTLEGGDGHDLLRGGTGNDLIRGDAGDDVLHGEGGDDTLDGGAGNDTFYIFEGSNHIDGGAGSDTLRYQDAAAAVSASLVEGIGRIGNATDTILGVEHLVGSAHDDVLTGNDADNLIQGGAGADLIDTGAGNDTVDGQDGDDTILGGAGNDGLRGQAGNDWIEGGDGNDGLTGHDGDDTLLAGDGNDQIYPGLGRDLANGGEGTDWIRYDDTDAAVSVDLVTMTAFGGAAEGDTLSGFENVAGSRGDDTLTGDDGDNYFFGNTGNDIIRGGAGNDTVKGGAGADTMDGGEGKDVLDLSDSDAAFRLDLDASTVTGGFATGDVISGFENAFGSVHADTLLGSGEDNDLRGGAGDDVIDTRGGNDWGFGGDGNDLIETGEGDDQSWGEAGDDTLRGGAGNDMLQGGAGADLLDGGTGINRVSYTEDTEGVIIDLGAQTVTGGTATGDTIIGFRAATGGTGDDFITGDDGPNGLDGGEGDDTLLGGAGNDQLSGNLGADYLDGGDGIDWVRYNGTAVGVHVSLADGIAAGGAAEGDTIRRIEYLFGSDGDDTLVGDDGTNMINGWYGSDVLDARGGEDWLHFGQSTAGVAIDLGAERAVGIEMIGADTLPFEDTIIGFEHVQASNGDDTITGTAGDNRLGGERGDDVIHGGAGDDIIGGGDGDDTLFGEAGDDVFDLSAGRGRDRVDGGDGTDRMIAEGTGSGIVVTFTGDGTGLLTSGDVTVYDDPDYSAELEDGQRLPDAGASADFAGLEDFVLGRWDDRFDATADSAGVAVAGGGGNDSLLGGSGDDHLTGDAGTWAYRLYDLPESPVLRFADAGFDIDGPEPWNNSHPVTEASVTATLAPHTIDRGTYHALAYSTVLTIAEEGDYAFNLRYTTGARLYVDGVAVLGTDGGGTNPLGLHTEVPLFLAAGAHRLDIVFIQETGGQALTLAMAGPDTGGNLVDLAGYAGLAAPEAAGNDTIDGGAGHDRIDGGAGADLLLGGDGDDVIHAGAGDSVDGGAGDDVVDLVLHGAGPVAMLSGGAGTDLLRLTVATAAAVEVDLAAGEVRLAGDVVARIDGFETVETLPQGGSVAILGGPAAETLVLPATGAILDAGAGNDSVLGGAAADVIDGGADHDTIDGGDGADTIYGGAGDDSVDGGTGMLPDSISGGDGNDFARGRGGDDVIAGDAGFDTLVGEQDDDTLLGGSGNDNLTGGDGADLIDGGPGSDTAAYGNSTAGVVIDLALGIASGGQAEGDTLRGIENVTGSAHADRLTGDDGRNVLTGGGGDDTLIGGDRFDQIYGGEGADSMDGGPDTDWLRYNGTATGVHVNLATGEARYGAAEGDVFANFENLFGSNGDDTLVGDDGPNFISGHFGSDSLDGGGGEDFLYYGAPHGGIVADLTTGRVTGFDLVGSDSLPFVDTVAGFENIQTDAGDDTLIGDDGPNQFRPGAGHDVVHGNGGDDLIDGSDGDDTLNGGDGNDTFDIRAGSGRDVIDGGAGTDRLLAEGTGAASEVVFTGDGAGWLLSGDMTPYDDPDYAALPPEGARLPAAGARADFTGLEVFVLGRWHDSFDAGAGGSGVTVTGGGGDDTLIGGAGADRLEGDSGTWDYRLYDLAESRVETFGEAGFRLGVDEVDPWDNENDLSESGITSQLIPATIDHGDYHAIALTSTLTVETAGSYLFNLRFTDGAMLFIDGEPVLGDDRGGNSYVGDTSGPVQLDAGERRLDIIFFQNEGGQALRLAMSGPDTGDAMVDLDGHAALTAPSAAGADRLDGGAGDDWLQGGAGADVFVLSEGHDTIADFDFAVDRVDFGSVAVDLSDGNVTAVTVDGEAATRLALGPDRSLTFVGFERSAFLDAAQQSWTEA